MSEQQKPSDPKVLYIFRHGETDWNKQGRVQGNTDIPLNETGRKQAERLIAFFEEHPVDVFLSSDLSRAVETARIASGKSGREIIQDMRLRETNMGDAEGLTDSEFEARFGNLLQEWRRIDSHHVRFPNGESKAEHLERVLEGLEEYASTTPHGVIGVACHGGAMRRLIHHMRPELDQLVGVGNCFVFKFTYDPPTKKWTVEPKPVCGD